MITDMEENGAPQDQNPMEIEVKITSIKVDGNPIAFAPFLTIGALATYFVKIGGLNLWVF